MAVVSAIMQRDRRRNSPDELALIAPSHLFTEAGPRRDPVPGAKGLWLLTGISNKNKEAILKQIIAAADPDPSAGSRWNGTSNIEWWLPTWSPEVTDPASA